MLLCLFLDKKDIICLMIAWNRTKIHLTMKTGGGNYRDRFFPTRFNLVVVFKGCYNIHKIKQNCCKTWKSVVIY